jgi:outer membrane protein OmpA-like peptidoglycan-associated protein
LIGACAHGPVLRGKIAGLDNVVTQAEKNGALKCAPRELALAKSHLRFATTDLDQGEPSHAEAHIAIAAPNAHAALQASPPERCSAGPGDRDGDGIPDAEDKCPDVRENYNGFEDEDGCPDDPDTDGDRIGDSKDQCVLEPEDADGYLDDDGCPELDNDSDGIPDAKDKCPNQPEDMDGFQDEDGCPDPDNDGDTVLDVDDQCPNTPGSRGGDRPGCPRGLVIVTAKELRITQQIQFDFNKATIKPVSFPILSEVRDVLRDNPKITLEIQGHTDNVGNGPYNMKLSQSRADSVMAYLVSNGIEARRLVAKGYGMTQPLVKNDTEAHRALNRRVQFIRTETGPPTP